MDEFKFGKVKCEKIRFLEIEIEKFNLDNVLP